MRYRVFAYGTLMFPEIAAAVAGERLECEPARLPDHARHALRQRPYPGAVPCPGRQIEGVLCHDVSARALARIDAFEGGLYRRHHVAVRFGDQGESCGALVYLLRPRWHPLLLRADWCPDTFRERWLEHYLREQAGSRAHRTVLSRHNRDHA